MSADKIKLLRKTPIFSTFDSASLKKICGFFKEKTYSSDETIFKEGMLGDTLFVIKDGAIKISRAAREGEEEESLTLRREGDIFGESGFLDESPRFSTAQATKTTKVLQLTRSDFLTILNNHSLTAYQIVKILSARVKQSDLRIIDELKEKHEQLQQAYYELQETADGTGGQEWPGQPEVATGEKEKLLDQTLSSVPYPLVCTGADNLIFLVNEAAEDEFGYSNEEIMGKPLSSLWADSSWLALFGTIQEKLNDRGMWEGQIIAKKRNGEQFLSFVTVTEMLDQQEKTGHKLYLIQNVTQNEGREQEERMREKSSLRRTTAEQIANIMGEELKGLSTALETLPLELDEVSLGKSTRTVGVMRDASQNLRTLVLDLTSSPALPASKQPLDLVNFFQKELLLLKSQEKFRDIIFATHFQDGIPRVSGNRLQLQQVLYAILENAAQVLQETPDRVKTVTIEVSGINEGQGVQIQISDNGTGIAAANLSRVFKERFTTKGDGLGLGLLWAAEIVKDHGGNIEVYSDEGTYSLFVIKLPALEKKPAPLPQTEPGVKTEG